jgi:hypothetical protein
VRALPGDRRAGDQPRADRHGRASEYSYQRLEWAWEQYCREQTLTAASAWLVNYHHQPPLTQAWGSEQLSSSDGQRFASRTRGPGTAALPRYFGHRRRGEPQAEEVEGAEHDLAIRNGVIGRVPAETFASPRLSDAAPAGPCLGGHLRELRLSLLDDSSVGLDENIADRRRVSRELRRAVLDRA